MCFCICICICMCWIIPPPTNRCKQVLLLNCLNKHTQNLFHFAAFKMKRRGVWVNNHSSTIYKIMSTKQAPQSGTTVYKSQAQTTNTKHQNEHNVGPQAANHEQTSRKQQSTRMSTILDHGLQIMSTIKSTNMHNFGPQAKNHEG